MRKHAIGSLIPLRQRTVKSSFSLTTSTIQKLDKRLDRTQPSQKRSDANDRDIYTCNNAVDQKQNNHRPLLHFPSPSPITPFHNPTLHPFPPSQLLKFKQRPSNSNPHKLTNTANPPSSAAPAAAAAAAPTGLVGAAAAPAVCAMSVMVAVVCTPSGPPLGSAVPVGEGGGTVMPEVKGTLSVVPALLKAGSWVGERGFGLADSLSGFRTLFGGGEEERSLVGGVFVGLLR